MLRLAYWYWARRLMRTADLPERMGPAKAVSRQGPSLIALRRAARPLRCRSPFGPSAAGCSPGEAMGHLLIDRKMMRPRPPGRGWSGDWSPRPLSPIRRWYATGNETPCGAEREGDMSVVAPGTLAVAT